MKGDKAALASTAWTVFYITIFILIITIFWSLFVMFGKKDKSGFGRGGRNITYVWYLIISLLLVAFFLGLYSMKK